MNSVSEEGKQTSWTGIHLFPVFFEELTAVLARFLWYEFVNEH